MSLGSTFVCVAVFACVCAQEVKLYDAYFGKPLSDRRNNYLSNVVNGSILCTVPVRPCRKGEGRRVDGTCTNPKYPSRGATLTPLPRLLPAWFGTGNTLRTAKDGTPLPSTRHIRTTLMTDGHVTDKVFSSLATDIFVLSVVDSVELFYLFRYVLVNACCPNNQMPVTDVPGCISIPVPQDDPYFRRASIRCMNLTRVETYQDYGCIPATLPAERYNYRATPLLDLSVIYGYTEERSRLIRAMVGGQLAFTMEEDREVPAGISPFCTKNQRQNGEISCYNYGDDYGGNLLLGSALTAMWFFREHNRLARALAAINPCWDDQKLFETARQINIAQWQYIFYYELIPELIGYDNALNSGIIYSTKGYVNDFDPMSDPGVYHEYVIGIRRFHSLQPGYSDLYKDHMYVGSRPVVDDTLRSGILSLNNTEAHLNFREIYQPSDRIDSMLDPELGNRALGELQAATDIAAVDIMRGRDAGLPPYNHYRKLCGMEPANTFEDLHDSFNKDTVEFLSRLYKDVDDVDLLTAVYMERMVPGAYVGPTLLCIMTHNLLLWRHSDKFFFEHGGFPAALTENQLTAIRNTRVARVVCDNAVGIKDIQPYALLRKSHKNDFVPCDNIPGIDLQAWKDHICTDEYK